MHYELLVVLAFVSATFMLMLAASFTFVSAAFVMLAALVVLAALLTGLSLAAVLGTLVDAGLTVVSSASGVSASALVVALVFADLGGVGSGAINSLLVSVVVASGHAESESGSDKSSKENFLHLLLIDFMGRRTPG